MLFPLRITVREKKAMCLQLLNYYLAGEYLKKLDRIKNKKQNHKTQTNKQKTTPKTMKSATKINKKKTKTQTKTKKTH